jgi:hypothetical protein
MDLTLILGLAAVTSAHAALQCTEQVFEKLLHVYDESGAATINWVNSFAAGDSTFDPSGAFPTNATNLPELCGISIHVPSSSSSAYNFAIFLPTTWNNRFMMTGNGGFGGGINVCLTGLDRSMLTVDSTLTWRPMLTPALRLRRPTQAIIQVLAMVRGLSTDRRA